ncbi:unnamed protein product [Symbiodinium sp. KB8]|nr:unnamed protein product [Symbiodinium sp. KB8]
MQKAMPSPGPGSYDLEYISFDDYMPKTLRHSKTGNGQGRMTAEQAQKAEAGTCRLHTLGASRAWREALEVIQAFRENALEVNVIHRNALLSVFQRSQQWSWALQELSARLLEQEVATDVISFSTAAATCPGWLKPLFFLDWMAIGTCRPNVVSISSALAACREGASWPLALDLLRSMHPVHGVLPNVVSLSSVLKACASASRWHEALEVFVEAAARLVPNIVARNAAQSACASEGLWASSLSGFQASLGRDLVSINTAIDACDKARRWEWAVAALQRAAVASLVPDVVTYSTATSACQSGHGWKLAISLVLEISQRHMRPNAASWTAAAGACAGSRRGVVPILVNCRSAVKARARHSGSGCVAAKLRGLLCLGSGSAAAGCGTGFGCGRHHGHGCIALGTCPRGVPKPAARAGHSRGIAVHRAGVF